MGGSLDHSDGCPAAREPRLPILTYYRDSGPRPLRSLTPSGFRRGAGL
jgi:hypothetical protein